MQMIIADPQNESVPLLASVLGDFCCRLEKEADEKTGVDKAQKKRQGRAGNREKEKHFRSCCCWLLQ